MLKTRTRRIKNPRQFAINNEQAARAMRSIIAYCRTQPAGMYIAEVQEQICEDLLVGMMHSATCFPYDFGAVLERAMERYKTESAECYGGAE